MNIKRALVLSACLLVAGGCQPLSQTPAAREEFRQTAQWLGEEQRDVVELEYTGPLPSANLRSQLGLPFARNDDEFYVTIGVATIGGQGRVGHIQMSFAVNPPMTAQWALVHERLVDRGYRKTSQCTWSYRAPEGVRQKAWEIVSQIQKDMTERLKPRLGDAGVVMDDSHSDRNLRRVHIWFNHIDSRMLWRNCSNGAIENRYFPTLGLVVSSPCSGGLSQSEQEEAVSVITDALGSLIQMDSRYYREEPFHIMTRPATQPATSSATKP